MKLVSYFYLQPCLLVYCLYFRWIPVTLNLRSILLLTNSIILLLRRLGSIILVEDKDSFREFTSRSLLPVI